MKYRGAAASENIALSETIFSHQHLHGICAGLLEMILKMKTMFLMMIINWIELSLWNQE